MAIVADLSLTRDQQSLIFGGRFQIQIQFQQLQSQPQIRAEGQNQTQIHDCIQSYSDLI